MSKKKDHVVEDYGLGPWVRLGWHFTVACHRIISERLIPVIILLQLLHDGKRDGRCHARMQKPHIMSRHSASRRHAPDSSMKNVTRHNAHCLSYRICRYSYVMPLWAFAGLRLWISFSRAQNCLIYLHQIILSFQSWSFCFLFFVKI